MNKDNDLYEKTILDLIEIGPILSIFIRKQLSRNGMYVKSLKYNPAWKESKEPNNVLPLVPKNTDLSDEEWIEYLGEILVYDNDYYITNSNSRFIDAHWLIYNEKEHKSEIKSCSLANIKRNFDNKIKT